MKFARNVFLVNTHGLKESDFHAEKCCHLVSLPNTNAAAFRQFLIYSTFILVALLVVAAAVFLQATCTSCRSTNTVKALKNKTIKNEAN